LWVDEQRARRNIDKIARKARENNAVFRPHFKTHQSLEIANWFRDYSVTRIAVSSIRMGLYFAMAGWDDITVAFPVNLREMRSVNYLAGLCKLNVLVEDAWVIGKLNASLERTVGCFIKIDIGTGRTGIGFDNADEIEHCAKLIRQSKNLEFRGFLMHAGHTYNARSADEVTEMYRELLPRIENLRRYPGAGDGENPIISFGDTPSCTVVDDLGIIDELRPGNFIFFDLMQVQIGSCHDDDIAVAVSCPVVSVHQNRREVVLMGGAIHFGRDYLLDDGGTTLFGKEVLNSSDNWSPHPDPGTLRRLSQEHGIVEVSKERVSQIRPGDVLTFLPVHSCMTAQYMGGYRAIDGHQIDHFARSSMYYTGREGIRSNGTP